MKRIGLLSDTHSFLDPTLLDHFSECDEIWHAGDIGDIAVAHQFEQLEATFRAVYGNIDDKSVTAVYPRDLRFDCEGLDVFITHIGGYPGRYNKRIKEIMETDPPQLFICGHSHILKVIYDKKFESLHMNPGACGHHGFHKIRTAIRFSVGMGAVKDAEIIELGQRGRMSKKG